MRMAPERGRTCRTTPAEVPKQYAWAMLPARRGNKTVRLIANMPHFTIQYSANLDSRLDIGEVVELVRSAAVETGIFPLGGIRVRAIRCEHYAIADGNPHHGFLDMVLRLGEGRDLATRQRAGEHIFRALSDHLDPVFATGQFALSFDMQINDKETSWKRNNIHGALKARAEQG
jgi:5-carboxymethyl-2-hydroxymuconate isomerase